MFNMRRNSAPVERNARKKCKIRIKKHSDGSITKEISGECRKEELEALKAVES